MSRNVKLLSKFPFPSLKDSQISDKFFSKSAELLERAGYIRKVNSQRRLQNKTQLTSLLVISGNLQFPSLGTVSFAEFDKFYR